MNHHSHNSHDSYGLLKVAGIDAKKLLQGQLTCDLNKATDKKDLLGAHCNSKGRVISLFYLSITEDTYCLKMLKAMVPVALAALKKYALFYKVELSDTGAAILQDSISKKQMINEKIPTIYPETSGIFLPHEIYLNELGALSFDKGCYTGQEIIARMHYLGKLKNRLYHATIVSDSPPVIGSDIYYLQDQKALTGGTLVDYCADTDNTYHTLIVTGQLNAKSNHLFLHHNAPHFFEIRD